MRSRWKILFLSVCAVAVFAAASWPGQADFRKEVDLFGSVMSLIRVSYVDDISLRRLAEGAMNGMLKTLDPYSQYLDEKAYQELKSETKGEFGGIGLEVSVKGGLLHVISPLDGTPADLAGVRPGDLIVKIDAVATKDMTLAEAVRRMRGVPGSAVMLSVIHEGGTGVSDIEVKREVVKVPGVREAKMLEGGIGYIRVSEFQEQTAKDFKKALDDLQGQGLKALIVDVRNNPGGLLSAAVDVAENFIPAGKVIVSTKGRLSSKSNRYVSRNKEPLEIKPFVLLVNKGSASGSEILAGAAQDYGFATLVGTRTYGKGCVQTLTPLKDGTAVRITTSKYYTPNGRLIHEVGITPDVVVADNSKNEEDLQLIRALEHIRVELTHA